MNEGTQDLSPITENTELSTSQTKHHYYHISAPKRGSIRRLKTSGHGKNETLKQEIYNMLLSLKNRKDLEEVPKQYNTLIKEYYRIYQFILSYCIDHAYYELSQSSFIQLFITVAFEYVNDDLFDELLPVAIDYIKAMDEDKKVSQLIIHTISMDMILNILKTMKGTEVDKRILFLQFIAELVKDRII